MNASIQKTFVIAISITVVLFLLFDGGSLTATTVSGDMANTDLLSAHTWIWIVPTLLIFGLGFLLAWILLRNEETVSSESDVRSRVVQGNACYWERADDPRHVHSRSISVAGD